MVKFGAPKGNGNGNGKKDIPSKKMRTESWGGRKPTSIMVRVLDISKLVEGATRHVQKKGEWDQAETHFQHGMVLTSKGMFMLLNEGVGSRTPISKEHPYRIEFWGRKEHKGAILVSGFPVTAIELTDAELLEVPVKKTVNLAEFIRVFGHRLDENYEEWRRFLEPGGPS